MKYFALVFFVSVVVFGCESEPKAPEKQVQLPKVLDWTKSASDQNLQIGDTITVEGFAFNIFPYEYKPRKVTGIGHVEWVAHLSRPIAFPAELSIPLYNPDRPHVTLNPNVPIGAVVCVIYNPMHIKDLGFDNKELYKLYPSRIPLESESDALLYGRKEFRDKKVYE